MTIRNWIKFFFMCMVIGGIVTGVAGIIIRWNFFQPYLADGEIVEFLAAFGWMILLGFTMSVIAQAGFFAYLTIHQVGVGVFKTLTLWNWVQALLILIVLFDLIVFRFAPSAQDYKDWLFYIGLLLVLVFGAIATAIKKVQLTDKKHILVSALFFMIVITSLEWIIALMGRQENIDTYVALLLFPLVAVNAYQLLALPKYNAKSDEDRKKLEARRKERQQSVKKKAEA
ncbi:KinB-signaling pathway activation protein [Ureibacillus massiliensis 4400831 = CIP 108448 = CCUG 49529]|uniref:KinB-signaling pathway activation protein n=1 Tax=Ureibacillus massiliensis 4400831 = CIP 108448 = CCUG 49529 TaxID=1211035 RepID=A0A0A3J8C8_9BACL|nr:KinB-signaling pathway activation protein [Ureibacillus massiliensis]KGR92025.1 KinB-signaling pathway activation protein [Ureibacillus massiliensis 4400831 = CIP 108448 = CCUG 49529]